MKKIFKEKIKLLIGLTFLALFIFNTIAYSGLATKLAITSEAMFRPNVDIRITNIKLHSAENGAVESYSPKYNVDSTTTGFVLPNTSSKITYEVTVTNYGNVRQTIYKFIKNSISTDGVNIEISNFKPVYSDTSTDYNCTTDGTTANKNCTYKNSDFTIVSNKNYDDDKENEKVFYITFSTTNPSSTAKNVIENYKYRPVYKIDFNANGGQNAPSSIYKVFGESTVLPKGTPTRSSYNFTGWSKSSTSTTAEYLAGTTYEPSEDANSKDDLKNMKDVTLYAVWQKKQATIDLNYNIDGTWYYSGYNNKIQTGIKVGGVDKGYLNDFSGTYDYGTSYEIYGFKIDGVTIPYSKKYTVDGTNHLGISFNTINFKVNDTNLGSITPTQLIVIPGTTYTISNNIITLSDGRIATASPKTVTGYTSKFSSYTITPNSTTINAKTTAQANFTKEANTYKVTLDNKSATTAGTTAIYEKYNTGIYLDSALTKVMTTSANPITKPAKTGYTFKGYYTKENGQGDQIINENGYITDKVTNTKYTANTTLYAYYKDETKPTLTLTNSSNGNWTNKDVTITLNGADSGSGIKEYQLKYSGSSNAWKKTTASKDTWGAERNETVYYRVVDNAGNESDAVSTSIRIDKTAPKIELNGAASSSEINNNSVTIPIKITETASGINNSEFAASDISVLINGTTVNPSTKTLTYNNVSNGIYSYTLTLSGITLNGKVTLEIAAGAVKDIATNSNSKTTLDPSITVSNTYKISLNGNGATTAGTTSIYEKYNTGIYLDSALTKAMTTSTNPITKPSRSYIVSFNANNTGITVPSAITKSYSYSGYYTDASAGTQMINENGYITSSFKNTSYTSNGTLYVQWKAKPSITIPEISKTGYTCSWNTSADGNGTTYNGGDVTDKLNTQTLYAVCKANTYKISYDNNYLKNDLYGTTSLNMSGSAVTRPTSRTLNTNANAKYGKEIEVTMPSGTGGGPYFPYVSLTSGKTYTWIVYVKTSSNKTLSVGHEQGGTKVVNVTTEWQRFTYTFTANDNQYKAFHIYVPGGSSTWNEGDKLYVHSLELAETDSTLLSSQDKTYGTTLGTLPSNSRTGYTFSGWYTDLIGGTQISSTTSVPSSDTTYYAHWTPNTNTAYKVVHQQMGLDGSTYTTVETESLTGTTDSSVSPAVKSYAGFTSPSVQTVTIAADGSTVVTYKYTRNKYTYTLGSATGITTTGSTASGSYYYGSTITLKATANTGYIFTGWTSSNTNLVANQTNAIATFTMPAGNITMTPSATAKSLTFNDQSFNRTYNPTTDQKVGITAATGGSGSYSYTITSGNTSYFSISGTSITVKAGTPANTYTLKVLAKDTNTKATKEATITIAVDKKTTSAPVSPTVKIYNAAVQNHGITIPEGASIVESKSTLSAINVGTYNVVFTLNSNYKWNSNITGDITVSWRINAYNINNATISSVEEQKYTGNEIKPTPTVTVPIPSGKTTTLVNGTDFTYGYVNHTSVGTGTISVIGKGNYTGTAKITFKIVQAENTAQITANDLTYNTQVQNLVSSSNVKGYICYSLSSVPTSCTANSALPQGTNAGTYTVYYYVKGNNNYKAKTGSVQVTIKKYNLSNATISGLSNKTYNGSAQTQSGFTVTVPIPSGHTSIPTYTTSYNNNTNAGTATMTLTGTGNYTGTKSATFTIGKATNPGTVTANTLTYNTQAQNLVISSKVQGNICYSLSAVPSSCNANSAIPQGTNAGTYKVYYLISGNSNYNSKSDSVNVTIKQYDISKNATIGSVGDQKYTGSAITPTPSVTVPIPSGKTTTLVNGTDFTYGYSNNTSVGTGTINVTGKGNYTGTKSTTFKIAEKASSCTITSVPTLKYPSSATGTIKFSCTGDGSITVSSANEKIIEISSYNKTSAYLTALKAGTTKITVSQAAGNYAASSVSADIAVSYSTYTVTLDGNGATKQGSTSAVATYNSTTLSSITLPERSYKITYNMGTTGITKPDDGKADYTFTGWYTSYLNNGGTKVANNAATPALEASVSGYTNASKQWTKSTGATLYAHWTAVSTKIAELQKEGYSCHWNTSSNGSGANYESGQTVDTITSDITLYPMCSINQYVLTVNPNGGTWKSSTSASTITQNYGTTTTINNPVRTGYKFTGWTLTGKGSLSGTTYTFGAGAGTLTANWEVKQLNFADQSYNRTYNPTTNQNVSLTPATDGSGSYSYSITSGDANYFSINGISIKVKAGTPANTYTLKVLAKDTVTLKEAEATITIIVDPKEIYKPTLSRTKVYNAEAQNVDFTIPEGLYIDESKSAISAINVGEYTVVLKLNSNYKWKNETTRDDVTATWYISAYNINNATIEGIEDQTYIPGDDGVKPKPKVTVSIPSGKTTTLVEGKDFTYRYFGNFNVGNATVSITGMGNYSSYKNATFKIVQAENSVKVEPIKQPNGKNLVYNKQAQTLVTTSNAQGNVCYSLESALTSCDTANKIPTATEAGTYTVYYYVKGNTNYKFKAGSVQVTIDKYNLSNATISGLSNKTYNGSAQTQSGFTVTVPIPSGKTSTPTYTMSYSNNTNVGTATMTLTGTGNYTGTKSATFTIGKATNPGTVTAKSLSYTGKAQELVSSNNVKGYICYSLSSTPTSCSANSDIPQGTNAGTYKVYYLISGDNNYNSKSGTVDVTIGRVNAVCPTVSVSSTSITYDGQSHEVGISGGSGGTIQYRTSTTASWTTTKPTITNAGEITTYVQVAGDSNHNTIDCGNKKIIIGKRATTCTTASASKDYNGTALTANSGTCTNLVSGHSATVSASGTITNAGSTANTYKSAVIKNGTVEVTTNYSITGANGTLTVRKVSAQNPTLTAYSGTYDGQSHTISVSGGSGGTIQYSTDNKTWSTTKPTRTNVGTTTVYVKVVGDGNHTDTNPISSTITITAQQLPAPKFSYSDISTAGIVTWGNVSNATKYQISIDGTNWTDATSGVDYLSKIIAATGTRTVYVRAVGEGNYSTSKNATASKSVYAVTINSNSTTMGKFDPSSATISYNVIEGATYSTSSNKLSFVGVTTGTTTKTLKTVTATSNAGYHFGSWSSVSGSITSDITITANFAENTYKVKFDSNGGTGTMADQAFTYGKADVLTANAFTKTGYTFKGWTSSDGNIYNDKQSVSNLTNVNGGTVTLKALWEANVYNISLSSIDLGYASDTELGKRKNKIYLKYGDGIYLNYDNGKLSNKMTKSTNNIYKPEIKLIIDYYVSYSGDSSKPTGTTSVEYPFMGYYTIDGKQIINENGYIIDDSSIYTLFTSDSNITMKVGDQKYQEPSATKDGYTFEGWFDKPGAGSEASPAVKIDETHKFIGESGITKSIYAHWLKNVKIKTDVEDNNWSFDSVSVSPVDKSTSDSGSVSYQYCFLDSSSSCSESDWKEVTSSSAITIIGGEMDEDGNYVESTVDGYIRYRAVSKYAKTPESASKHIKIDRVTPSTTLTAYKTGTTETVESGNWTNSYLEFKFGDITTGPSGGIIRYCINDYEEIADDTSTASDDTSSDGDDTSSSENVCVPTTQISPNTAISVDLTNKKEGTYNVVYNVTSNTGVTSETYVYNALVDVTAPKIVVIPSKKDGNKITKLDTVTASSMAFPDWAIDEYIFDLSTSTDTYKDPNSADSNKEITGSGIQSVLVETNKGGLLTTDSNYREHPTQKTYNINNIKDLDPIEIQADGYRHGVITVTDKAGNSSKFTFTVKIDGVKPVISIKAYDQSGKEVKSGELSSTGLTFKITIDKSGVSPVKVYSCSTTTDSYDPDNPCTPSTGLGSGRTGTVITTKGYANTPSMDRMIRVKGVSTSNVTSTVKKFNGRIGTVDVDIVVARTDNSAKITKSEWVNSTIKFKLTSKATSLKYCVGTSKCTPNTAITSGTVKSLTNTGKFYIGYQATTGSTVGSVHYFAAYVDTTPPTIKITPYKLKSDNKAGTKVGDTVTNTNLSLTTWVNYGYYFSLAGSTDGSGSGIESTTWEYNSAGSLSIDHTITKTSDEDGLNNSYLASSGYRYAKVTLTDKAGNTRTIAIGARIDKVAPKLVLKLYKSVNGKKTGKALANLTKDYRSPSWVNHLYYFDTTGSSDSLSGIKSVTIQGNSAGAMTDNKNLVGNPIDITDDKGRSISGQGNRYIRVVVKDKAGNTTTRNARIFSDLSKPELTWGNHSINGSEITIYYTCKDSLSRLKNANGTIVSSYTDSVKLSSSGSKPGKCVDRVGNKVTSNSPTWYYDENPSCGVKYTTRDCWTETKQDYLGMESDYSCVTSGNVCKDPSLGTKCSCYSQPYEETVCGNYYDVYNTCWHK